MRPKLVMTRNFDRRNDELGYGFNMLWLKNSRPWLPVLFDKASRA